MIDARITNVEKTNLVYDNSEWLDVSVEYSEDGAVLETRKYGFPLATSEEEIRATVQKCKETYQSDKDLAVANAEHEKLQKLADETIQNLTNLTL